jgi:hypothetical protein
MSLEVFTQKELLEQVVSGDNKLNKTSERINISNYLPFR